MALSAFDSFCRAAEVGRLPKLTDRDSLWSHLFLYTVRKAYQLVRRERAQKRGGGRVVQASGSADADGEPSLLDVLGREPMPELAAMVVEEHQRLLDRLPSNDLRSIVVWKPEGYTNDEIAAKLGCVRRSVERMLNLIRRLWNQPEAP